MKRNLPNRADALYNDKTSVEQRAFSQLRSILNLAQNKAELIDEITKSLDALHLKIVSQVMDTNSPCSDGLHFPPSTGKATEKNKKRKRMPHDGKQFGKWV
jgi:hypothetical protein